MKFTIGLLCVLGGSLSLGFSGFPLERPQCVLFYYHHEPLPLEALKAYDWIVLDADYPHLDVLSGARYAKACPKLLAYVSVGEIEPYRTYFASLRPYILGANPTWGSYVADLLNPRYLRFILDQVVPRIAQRGFDGFVLDTLDSYELCVDKEKWANVEDAEVSFIEELRRRYPEKLIVVNRAFAIFSRIRPLIDGFLCEGLYHSLDARRRYVPVGEEERQDLLARLREIQGTGIPVIVIDYVPPRSKKLAKATVSKIARHGFIPYVADRDLATIGFSPCKK
ncbi:endo alpha-1,4 polygalactosaminidase [Candidatus Caldatribacterium sp.]|uniref:endo alpha-1,4 polygalactosaminidase n=1 Tax=Candidatus Caldatribacterium sp. TaxID=2282143 RepID=UPI003843369F|nr:endo alpha-1,4 polygalactosaminidase [Candidatus Caldatribacterium sp.]